MPLRNVTLDQLARWLVLLGYCLTGCTEHGLRRYDSEFLSMGTQAQLTVWASSPAQAALISRQVEQQLNEQGIDWYPWTDNPEGELRQLNQALSAGEHFKVSASLAALLQKAMELHIASNGYFDPAIAPMTLAWGFADSQKPAITVLPANERLNDWKQSRPRLVDLQLHDGLVSSERRDLQLDLGAIAKGYALDLAMQRLRQSGMTQASLNLGGQILLMGKTLPESTSVVTLSDPRAAEPLGKLVLQDGESISTSGDYQRSTIVAGQRIHHLLDPHTGAPVMHTQMVTVIAGSGVLADAASTALMAAGPAQWQGIARTMGIREALRIDATGKIEVSTALYARLRWSPQAIAGHSIQQVSL